MTGRGGASGLRREATLVALVGGGLGIVGWLLATLGSYRAPPVLCVVVGLAAAATWRLVVAAEPPPEPPVPTSGDQEPEPPGFASLSTLEYRLSWGSVDPDRYEERLRPQLIRLAEQRLRQRHGVDPARQPDVARRIVGEPLWQLMTGPRTTGPPPTPSRIADLLMHIERI